MRSQLKIRVELELDFGELSKVFYEALKPDERFKLDGLSLGSRLDGDRLVVEVECSRGAKSALSTLNDLFAAISTLQEICGLALKKSTK